MSDECLQWQTNPGRNPRTNRKILINGPTFKNLEKECRLAPGTQSRLVKYYATLFNVRIFNGLFTDNLIVKFQTEPTRKTRSPKCVIYLSRSLQGDQLGAAILREMCACAAKISNDDDIAWQKWAIKADTQFPGMVRKCYDASALGECDDCDKGFVYSVGDGDTGQLGLGPDIFERKKPSLSFSDSDCVQVCAGGLHSVCLTSHGRVYTFGCNDAGALGRVTEEESIPGMVSISKFIIQVSAGDSHTAALASDGTLFAWGSFRDSNGVIGHVRHEPVLLMVQIVKVASGTDHLVCLSIDGRVYTMGSAEQGQLGRPFQKGTLGLKYILRPELVSFRDAIIDVWTGQYSTFAKSKSGHVYAWGLNNYNQLGFTDNKSRFTPVKSYSFNRYDIDWKRISGGQHHVLALSADGRVYSLGRSHYGRLGVGPIEEDAQPNLRRVKLPGKCVDISAGTAASFAVTETGQLYAWGIASAEIGSNDDVYEPKRVELTSKKCIRVSTGGQHALILACAAKNI
jgi:regulator of chromosome condensation